MCGQSRTFPICDFSHHSQGWQCDAQAGEVAEWCFVGGPHNLNLAEKLAADLNGVAAHTSNDRIIAKVAVILTEGTDLDSLHVLISRISAEQQIVFAMNIDATLVARAFPGSSIQSVYGESLLELWDQIRSACNLDDPLVQPNAVACRSAFLSHAVQDESTLQGAIQYLRRFYQADIFLCADSIDSGVVWQNEIVDNLQRRDLFILLVSSASVVSTFCAFEIGYAMSLEKPIALISLDGTGPPTFAQHLQINDVTRLRQRKPWLENDEALLESLLHVLAPP